MGQFDCRDGLARIGQQPSGTGRYIACYGVVVPKEQHHIYLEVMRGPSGRLFVRCPLCGLKAFLNGAMWQRAGFSRSEVVSRFLHTNIIDAPVPASEES